MVGQLTLIFCIFFIQAVVSLVSVGGLWEVKIESTGEDQAYLQDATIKNDTVVAVGYYWNNIKAQPIFVSPQKGFRKTSPIFLENIPQMAFVQKFVNGKLIWAHTLESLSMSSSVSMNNNDGSVIVTGFHYASTKFVVRSIDGTIKYEEELPVPHVVYLIKFKSDGEIAWVSFIDNGVFSIRTVFHNSSSIFTFGATKDSGGFYSNFSLTPDIFVSHSPDNFRFKATINSMDGSWENIETFSYSSNDYQVVNMAMTSDSAVFSSSGLFHNESVPNHALGDSATIIFYDHFGVRKRVRSMMALGNFLRILFVQSRGETVIVLIETYAEEIILFDPILTNESFQIQVGKQNERKVVFFYFSQGNLKRWKGLPIPNEVKIWDLRSTDTMDYIFLEANSDVQFDFGNSTSLNASKTTFFNINLSKNENVSTTVLWQTNTLKSGDRDASIFKVSANSNTAMLLYPQNVELGQKLSLSFLRFYFHDELEELLTTQSTSLSSTLALKAPSSTQSIIASSSSLPTDISNTDYLSVTTGRAVIVAVAVVGCLLSFTAAGSVIIYNRHKNKRWGAISNPFINRTIDPDNLRGQSTINSTSKLTTLSNVMMTDSEVPVDMDITDRTFDFSFVHNNQASSTNTSHNIK